MISAVVPGNSPTQGFDHTLSAEKLYSIDVTENNKKIV